MTQNGSGFRRLTTGLFVGGLLGGALGFLYALGGGAKLGSKIPQRSIQPQRRSRPFLLSKVGKTNETAKPDKTSVGWFATFVLAQVVAIIADKRMKNK